MAPLAVGLELRIFLKDGQPVKWWRVRLLGLCARLLRVPLDVDVTVAPRSRKR